MKNLPVINVILAFLIILINGYFLFLTFQIIRTHGGPMGYGYMALPVSISINFLLIPAYFALRKGNSANISFLWLNGIGLLWALFWLFLLVFKNNS